VHKSGNSGPASATLIQNKTNLEAPAPPLFKAPPSPLPIAQLTAPATLCQTTFLTMNLSLFLKGVIAVLLCLLTAILFSSKYLKWRPTFSTTNDEPKPEEPRSTSDPARTIGTEDAQNTAGDSSASDHAGKTEEPRSTSDPARTIGTEDAQNTAGDSSAPDHAGKPTCFRITGIPLNWHNNELKEAFRDVDLEGVELSIFPACSTKTQTALLRLDQKIAYFEGWKQSQEKQLPFKEQGRTKRLNIDKDFYGLTPLNSPDAPITAELVSLHVLENCQAR
jgi:hypothetical protein